VVRLPLDGAIRLLPGDGTGARATAALALDRADATVRAVIASVLSDEVLRDDARHRREAAGERERALRLRGQAEHTAERADTRLERRQEQSTEQRARANERAQERSREATREQKLRERRAAETESERLDTTRRAAEHVEQELAEREPNERLKTLDAKNDALRQKEKALAARDEARRLRDAAGRAKSQRKSRSQ
jgi:hypothetical protein